MILYEATLILWKDMFKFRIEKHESKETQKSFILNDNKRISKEKIDTIINDCTINSINQIRYVYWFSDNTKITEIKEKLKAKIQEDINSYKLQIDEMVKSISIEPINDFRDYTKEVEKVDASMFKF